MLSLKFQLLIVELGLIPLGKRHFWKILGPHPYLCCKAIIAQVVIGIHFGRPGLHSSPCRL